MSLPNFVDLRRALIIGSAGQIGTELSIRLAKELSNENVIAADIRPISNPLLIHIQTIELDVLNKEQLRDVIIDNQITEVYHLAATLSAVAEKNPEFSWHLNMQSLLNILDLAKDGLIQKIFWPSSIAVFGPDSPKNNTPQNTLMNPNTVYGISKLAGEKWCNYYFEKHNVDVRSLRFPGLLGYKADPGGGTTDYALWALKNASERKNYNSFLSSDCELPMMHMEDAVEAIMSLMSADSERLTVRTSYNVASLSFTPIQLESQIKFSHPEFKLGYEVDFRQKIAESWPNSLDDSQAKLDWGWNSKFTFADLVKDILMGFKKLAIETN